jgi:hypothetical protein
MALHSGIDTVAAASFGCYSETYGQAEQQNLCNLFASCGLLEDAPAFTLDFEYLDGRMDAIDASLEIIIRKLNFIIATKT